MALFTVVSKCVVRQMLENKRRDLRLSYDNCYYVLSDCHQRGTESQRQERSSVALVVVYRQGEASIINFCSVIFTFLLNKPFIRINLF